MMIKKLVILSIFLFFNLIAGAQEATAVLKDKQIKIGEQTTVRLELRTKADGQLVEFPSLLDTISGKIEIIKISEMDTSYDENDISIRVLSQVITITSWDSGFHPIPPFIFRIGNEEFSTQADLLEVTTLPIEAEADIKDIKKIIEVPFSLWDWILVNRTTIGGIILLLALIFLGIFLFKRLKKEKVEEKIVVPKEKADIVANRQLKELENEKLWQNNKVNTYYTRLSHILREYLENRFHISALEKTTDEIELLLKYNKEIDDQLKLKLSNLLQSADLAKFAKQIPLASENEEALRYSFAFVESTKLIEQVEEKNEDSSVEDEAAKEEVKTND